jgi:hypothetical protein
MGIFWTKKNKVAGGWRNLHSKEIHNNVSYPSWMEKIREMHTK